MDLLFTLFCLQVALLLTCLGWLTETARLKRKFRLGGRGPVPAGEEPVLSLCIEREDSADEEASLPAAAAISRKALAALLPESVRAARGPLAECPNPQLCKRRQWRQTFFGANHGAATLKQARKSALRTCKENTCPALPVVSKGCGGQGGACVAAPDRARLLIQEKVLKYSRTIAKLRRGPLFAIAEQAE